MKHVYHYHATYPNKDEASGHVSIGHIDGIIQRMYPVRDFADYMSLKASIVEHFSMDIHHSKLTVESLTKLETVE